MKTRTYITAVFVGIAAIAAGCASMSDREASQKALQMMKDSFSERGQAKLDRLEQDETQKLCSKPPLQELSKEISGRIEKANVDSIRYPSDGKLMGDWKSGERIAQNGQGKQFNDDPTRPSGANCYACHQLSKSEISYGTIGPSLYNFGKLRGTTDTVQRYAYGKIYNSEAFSACSNMPRFGHNGILTEQQMKDLTALLLDPNSPVNQ